MFLPVLLFYCYQIQPLHKKSTNYQSQILYSNVLIHFITRIVRLKNPSFKSSKKRIGQIIYQTLATHHLQEVSISTLIQLYAVTAAKPIKTISKATHLAWFCPASLSCIPHAYFIFFYSLVSPTAIIISLKNKRIFLIFSAAHYGIFFALLSTEKQEEGKKISLLTGRPLRCGLWRWHKARQLFFVFPYLWLCHA